MAAAALILSMASAVAQDSVAARGELREDSARLILDWGTRPAPGLAIDLQPDRMVLRFDRPVLLDTAAVRANLKAYFRDADLAADGRSLILPLKKPLTYRTTRSGSRVTLDFGQPGEAVFDNDSGGSGTGTQAQAAPVAPAPAAPEPQPAVPELRIRTGEHDGYSRLALDWPGVEFKTRQDGPRIELIFDRAASLDIARLKARLPKRLRDITASRDAAGNLLLALLAQDNVTATSFRNGGTIVVDLKDGAPPVPAASPPPQAADPVPQSPPPVAAPEPSPAPAAEPPSEVAQAPPDITLPDLQSAPPVGDTGQAASATPATAPPATAPPAVPEIATPVVVTKEPAATPSAAPPAPVAITATATPAENGVVLNFAFSEPTGLAAFKRGDSFWLVFGRPGSLDPAALVRAAPVLTGLSQIATPYGTVLRVPGTSRLGGKDMGVAITGDGRAWQLSLGPGRTMRPASELPQRRETLGNGGTSLLFQAAQPGAAIDMADPEAGDRVTIVPVMNSGLGLASGADWPDFRVLASYQGVAVVPVSERTRVESLPNGIVVTSVGETAPQLIAETEPTPAEPADSEAEGEAAAAVPAQPVAAIGAPGLFDLPAWRRSGEASFEADDSALRAAIETAPPSQKPAANLALAQFRFANGRNAETIDALDQLRGTALENDPLASVLRGAALALMGRDEDAAEVLDNTRVRDIPEARLFRAYLAARSRNWAAAAEGFTGALPGLDDFPKPTRMALRRAGAEAMTQHGDPLTAQTFLDGMRLDSPDAEAQAYHDYLSGKQQLRLGEKNRAAELWQKLAQSPVPEVRARSQFDLTELQLAEGIVDAREAAANLEALRFVWRGDQFEFDLLYRLGELYLESDQPRRGLTTLRQAATNFPTNPRAKAATDTMARAFRDLYLGNHADRLPPLTAVALYDEFRELTPSGIDGDRMITSLADRLVKVDLLDSAARLLENQVVKRLEGLDKARAGTRWAAVSLLDGAPDRALGALAESEIPDMPPDLIRERRRLQGRALFETGETLRGLALVRDDNTLDGLWLKADLQWRLREWPAAAAALDDLIRAEAERLSLSLPRPPTAEELAADPAAALSDVTDQAAAMEEHDRQFNERLASLVLNRATALSLANDRGGLRRLARQFGPQMAKGPYATAFATLTSPRADLADSISAAMESVDQLGAFVEDYRARLRAASLSDPAEPAL